MSTPTARIGLPRDRLAAFCRKWKISELALFGSVLREDFRPHSDVDVLVSFDSLAEWGLFEHVAMQEELSQLLGREVDLVSRRAIEASDNPIRRQAILDSAEIIYASR
ncbi:MAG: nucleotidyltransferase family protein [Thermoguttaceae bacterium]|jgi:predicted nucleotidyltransferase